MAAAITATGVKGFLLWLKQQQPGIYQRVAPSLPKLAPQAFTQHEQKLGKLREIYKARSFASRTPQKLGCYCSFAGCDFDSGIDSPITVDYSSQLSADFSSPVIDYSTSLSQVCAVSCLCPGAAPTLSCSTSSSGGTDVASAANSGTVGTGTANAIGSAINGVASSLLTASQAATLAKIISSQLSSAQAGLTPKPISTSTYGIPTVAAKMSGTEELLLLLGAGIAAWVLLS